MTAPPTSTLDSALASLRLAGAIFFRSEFTENWAYESPTPETVASILHPGAERLVMFHVVAAGRCWISVGDDERHWADPGDVIMLPYGDQHKVGGMGDAPCVDIMTLFAPPPWEKLPVLQYGAGGPQTDIVCGYLHSDDPLFDPALRALPKVLVVRPPEGPMATWVASSVEFAIAASEDPSTNSSPSTRLAEALCTEVLRLHLASAPAAETGWLAALRDPVLAPALAKLHAAPEQRWTVADLAAGVSVSRSVLDERFRTVLGRSPIRYLTDWRMHVAQGLLESTDLTVAQIAARVGYDAVESFSRAFKRSHGRAPSALRSA